MDAGREPELPPGKRRRDGVEPVQAAGRRLLAVQLDPVHLQRPDSVLARVGPVRAQRDHALPDRKPRARVPVDPRGLCAGPVHESHPDPLDLRRRARAGAGPVGTADELLDGLPRRAPGVVQPRHAGVGQHVDQVAKVVAPVVDRGPHAGKAQAGADVVRERLLGLEAGVPEVVGGPPRFGLGHVHGRRVLELVHVVHRRRAERRLHRQAQRHRFGEPHAQRQPGVEAAGQVVKLVVGGGLDADPVAQGQGDFGVEAVHGLRGVVRVEAVDQAERADLRAAALVAQNGTRVDRKVARVVGPRRDAEPAELITGREAGHALRQRALHHRVGDRQVGLAPQIDLIEEPRAQLGGVGQRRDVARVRPGLERRAGLLRVLDRAAEGVEPHAAALPRHGAVQRSQRHPRSARRVRHHVHAALGTAEASEREKPAVRVLGGEAHVARGARPADSRFQRHVLPGQASHGAVGGGRDAQGLRRSRHGARGTAVADRAPVEVPVVLKARGGRGEPRGLGVFVAEAAPTWVLRPHQVGAVVLVDRREGGRGGPLGRRRPGKESLDVIAPSVAPRAVELAEGAHVPRRLLQVVPRLVAHPAGLVFAMSTKTLARPVHEDSTAEVRASKRGGKLLGTLVAVELRKEKRARIADERPAAGARNEGSQGEVAVRNLQTPGPERFDRDHGVGAFPDGPAPDGADARGAGGGVVLVGRRELPALVVVPGEEVGHARHGVGAVHGRRALLQDLDPVQRDRRERVHVHEAASVHPHRHVRLAPAVEQHQRPRGSQAAKVHAGDRLGHGGGLGRVGEAVPFAEGAVAGAQVLEEVRGLGRPLFGEAPPARHRDRVGEGDGRVLEGGAGHDDLGQLQRRGVKPRVERRRLSVGDGHGADEAREADQLHMEFVDARADAGKHEPSVVVRQHADAQARDVDLSRRERRARGRVGDGSRNGSALGAGLRRCQHDRRDGRRKDPSQRPSGAARRRNSAPRPTAPRPTAPQPPAPRPRASREWIRLDRHAVSALSSHSSPIRLLQVGRLCVDSESYTPGRDRASPADSRRQCVVKVGELVGAPRTPVGLGTQPNSCQNGRNSPLCASKTCQNGRNLPPGRPSSPARSLQQLVCR